MHTAKYPEVAASYKNCHTDMYFRTKTVVAHAAKWNPVQYFSKHSIQSYAALPVAVANASVSKPQLL